MTYSLHFSILVPVYNVASYLRECLDSVLGQSYQDFELLLVDDGSTDDSGRICDEYAARDERIRVFHKENGGLISARRYAIARFTGDYCVFLDSDDTLSPDALEILAKAIAESGADCLIYGIRWNRPNEVEHIACPEEICFLLLTDKRAVLNILLNDNSYNSLCRKCVKASCFDGRDFSAYYHIKRGEDRLQSIEIMENATSFFFLPDELYIYRVNQTSITHSICYDGYRADFTISWLVLAMLTRLGLFREEDYNRLRNSQLDGVALEIKRICRNSSTPESCRAALRSIRENDYFQDFLLPGYFPVPSLPGVSPASSRLRRLLNRLMLGLLRRGRYNVLRFLCCRLYRAN